MGRAKRYRVTQFEQMSELGLALYPNSRNRNRPQECWRKDYRWLWTARFAAMMGRGESAGLGLRYLTTTITVIPESGSGTENR